MQRSPTRLADVPPQLGLLALTVLGAATVALIGVSFGLPVLPDTGPAHGDLDTYAEIVARLRVGEGYYAALHASLLEHGYATLSVFNWRPPLFLEAVAMLPSALWMQGIIAALALVGAGMAVRLMAWTNGAGAATALSGLLLLSLAAYLAPKAGLMCELLSGALILLSVSAYALQRPAIGFAAAAGALWMRELAGLYVVVCIFAAWREGRYREVGAWAAMLAVYGTYFAWHAWSVMGQWGPLDRADPAGWLLFGGAEFAILTATFNGVFLLLPNWVTAAMLPLAVVGLLAQPAGTGARRAFWTVLGYLVLFAFFGKPNNSYWGGLFTPLLALGLVWAPDAIRDLLRAARPPRTVPA